MVHQQPADSAKNKGLLLDKHCRRRRKQESKLHEFLKIFASSRSLGARTIWGIEGPGTGNRYFVALAVGEAGAPFFFNLFVF